MGKLDGKVAIVTGGGQGIGRAVVIEFAKEGASIVVAGRTAAKLESVVDEVKSIGGKASASACDVGVEADVRRTVSRAVEEYGKIDILMNNAQAFGGGKTLTFVNLEDLTEQQLDATFRSGFKGTFYFCKAVFPYMKGRGGKIVNVGSAWGMVGKGGVADYNSCKEAIRGLSMTAAREWGKHGINVNVICPHSIESDAVLNYYETRPGIREAAVKEIPLRRAGQTQDVGRLAVFLACSDSDFITGHTFLIDGGINMHS